MTSAVSIPPEPAGPAFLTGASPVGWASARGPRRHQADAAGTHVGGRAGRRAVAVADGVGDSPDAAFAARLVVDHAVRVAVLEGRPDTALLAAHDMLASTRDLVPGDAAAVVALAPGSPGEGDPRRRLAWVGDCRAYLWNASGLRVLTADQTVAAALRTMGATAHPRMEHVLTTSVATLTAPEIGIAVVDDPGTLLLVTDGVHRAVGAPSLAAALAAGGTGTERAERVVALATAAGTTDNATALVLA